MSKSWTMKQNSNESSRWVHSKGTVCGSAEESSFSWNLKLNLIVWPLNETTLWLCVITYLNSEIQQRNSECHQYTNRRMRVGPIKWRHFILVTSPRMPIAAVCGGSQQHVSNLCVSVLTNPCLFVCLFVSRWFMDLCVKSYLAVRSVARLSSRSFLQFLRSHE